MLKYLAIVIAACFLWVSTPDARGYQHDHRGGQRIGTYKKHKHHAHRRYHMNRWHRRHNYGYGLRRPPLWWWLFF